MNKQMKFFVVSLLTIGTLIGTCFALGGSNSNQTGLSQSWNTTEVSGSSATIWSGRGGYVKAIYVSTETAGTLAGTDWWVMIDTPTPTNVTFASFATATKVTPARMFPTTTTVGGITADGTLDFGDPVYLSSGCFIFKTAAASGEALKVFVKWKN